MSEEELTIAIISIIFGTALVAIIFVGAYKVINNFIESKYKSNSGDLDPQFFRALAEFKRTTEKRLNHLEAIVTEDDDVQANNVKVNPTGSIEIEDEEPENESNNSDNNLRNMLNE